MLYNSYNCFLFNGSRWSHTACTCIYARHRHASKKRIYAWIFGITWSPVAGLVGCQKHSSNHLKSEKHPPARHNMPPSISSHLFPSSMGLYGPFSSHKTTFVRHAVFLWCVYVSTGTDGVPTSQAALNMSGVHRSSTVLDIMQFSLATEEGRWGEKSWDAINQPVRRRRLLNPGVVVHELSAREASESLLCTTHHSEHGGYVWNLNDGRQQAEAAGWRWRCPESHMKQSDDWFSWLWPSIFPT